MRTRFDGLAKDALGATLDIASKVVLQHGVSAETQYFDVVSEPDPARAHERHRLGLLGRMTEERCALEPYHEAPDEEDLMANIRKQVTWQHVLTKKARSVDPAAHLVTLPLQWILPAGRPSKVLEHFEMKPLDGWPEGIYTAVRWARLRVAVLSELPRTPDTLILRLLAAGATLRAAMAELLAQPADAWERVLLVPLFLKFRFELPEDPSQRTPEEEAFIMTAQDYVESILVQGERKGRAEGLREGMEVVVAHQVERRLRRKLTEAEHATLSARMKELGAEQVSDLASDLATDALAAWLAAESG